MYNAAILCQPSECRDRDIDTLFAQHYGASLRTATRILRRREDAEDAIQSAYCRAFEHFGEFRGESSFKTWITRIVVNCCLMEIRNRPQHRVVPFDTVEGTLSHRGATPEVLCYWAELGAAHAEAASRLPNTLRAVYVDAILSGEDFADVVVRLRLHKGAAKSRLVRARKKIGHALSGVVRRKAM